ncbi:hypothetical protein EV197_3496 [Aquimarina brevivitae]|uniref:Uncharacterized protein n=2 Tax=Aquimarina brevivitae TaxID=323412 RepID=A0A4Q7NTQ7_9FLAO|nr:hypothetical protein EV197_3496 [Aquimarina brevivitae]
MIGCMAELLPDNGFSKSKNACECIFDFLITKYSDEKLSNDIEFEKILSVESLTFSFCNNKHIKLENELEIDTTKKYYKVRLMNNFKDNQIEIIDAYVDRKRKDTILNEFRYFNNGVLDSSKSKFFDLIITGRKDSIMEGRIDFYSPRDTLPKEYIYQRNISFRYIQEEDDCIVVKEIETDTNSIKFPYKNFRNFTFIGYISDTRFIYKESTTDSLYVNFTKFAIDNKLSTNNIYIDLLK